ncbi:hypothetical protein GCM10027059_49970 [Myceligenerans halotolerans]
MNASTDTPSVGGQAPADPRRLSAFLGLGLEAMLRGQEVPWENVPGGWDAWWVAVRSDGRLLPDSAMEGTCRSCREAASSFLPSAVSTVSCGCFEQWARTFTSPAMEWSLPQRLTVAMIKPGVPDAPIRAHLRGRFRIVKDVTRRLRANDVVRLTPFACGDFLKASTEYLTGGLVRVLVMHGGEHAIAEALQIKQTVRNEIGGDEVRDGLHVPVTPADALADIALLAGGAVQKEQYQRRVVNDPRGARTRIDAYQERVGPGHGQGDPAEGLARDRPSQAAGVAE